MRATVLFLAWALTGLAPAQDSARSAIPFPEEWDPFPLRFPYAETESLFLPKPQGVARPVAETPPRQTRTFALPAAAHRWLRVLLEEKATSVSLDAGSGARLKMKRSDGTVSEGPMLAGPVKIEWKGGEFRVAVPGRKAFSTGPARAVRFLPQTVSNPIGINGKKYRGDLELDPANGSGFQVLNVLAIEDYLRGVLPKEMGNRGDDALEALKAQAVVARTYALKRMLEASPTGFDVRASIQDQVYGGSDVEYPLSDRAVAETRALVLCHADTLAFCYYHSTCGGITAGRNEVWGGPVIPYLRSQPDRDPRGQPWCAASAYSQWTQTWTLPALSEIIRRNVDHATFHTVKGFKVADRFSCGRIRTLEVLTDQGAFELHGDKIRFALKPGSGDGRILESARFNLTVEGNQVIARGSGFGHGIGLCQMGALGRSAAGQGFAKILAAYYPGTEMVRTR